jgi:CBS-domain-containing membrane protein
MLRRDRVVLTLYRSLGAGVGIGLMEGLSSLANEPLARVPFVTSIVLTMALPDAAPAQPRAIIGGHVLSAGAGWLCLSLLGGGPLIGATAVGLATLAMILADCMHPPAGINAILITSMALGPGWILSPVLVGALLLTAFVLIWRVGERRLRA